MRQPRDRTVTASIPRQGKRYFSWRTDWGAQAHQYTLSTKGIRLAASLLLASQPSSPLSRPRLCTPALSRYVLDNFATALLGTGRPYHTVATFRGSRLASQPGWYVFAAVHLSRAFLQTLRVSREIAERNSNLIVTLLCSCA